MADLLTSLMGPMKEAMGKVFATQPAAATLPDATAAAPPADPYADQQAILDEVKRFRDDFGKREIRDRFLKPMYRNLLFYRSIQWIKWDTFGSRWRPANIPKGVPTPVTNVFADTMDTVNSVFGRVEPKLNWRPGTPDEPADRAAADTASRAIDVIEDECNIRMNRQHLAGWVGFTGGCFLESGYDPDPVHGMADIPMDQCARCGAQQPQGAPMCEACGEVGTLQPTTVSMPRGKMFVDPAPLFEMFFDPAVVDSGKHKRLLREKCLNLDEAKERWADFADQISPNVAGSADEHYMTALSVQGPALDDRGTGRRDLASTGITNNKVTERWYWRLPNKTYPDGLLAIVVGERTLVYAKPLPYYAPRADGGKAYFLPFVWFPQKLVPGTFWPKTVADDIAIMQADRNRWQSALMLCGMRMGMPIWLDPRGAATSGLLQGGGEAGTVVKYNALGPGSAKPERVPGQPLPMSFLEFIQQIDAKIESIAKTFDVLKGGRPEGVSAGIALQILQERGLSAWGQLFIMWEAGWAQWASQAIEIFRLFATEERLLKIKGPDGEWEVEKFIGADLQGRVDVIAEAGSSTPRSTLADRAETEQLMAYGIINRFDPEVQEKVMALYNKSDWLGSMSLDTKNAIMEDEAFEQIAAMPIWQNASPQDVTAIEMAPDYPTAIAVLTAWAQGPMAMAMGAQPIEWPKVYPALDGHAAHSRTHGRKGKTQTFRQWPPIVQAMLEKHKAYHDQLMVQQAAAVQGGGMMGGAYTVTPGAGTPARTDAQNTSSSPARMQGDASEMERDMSVSGGM